MGLLVLVFYTLMLLTINNIPKNRLLNLLFMKKLLLQIL
jgi:hypothetical protein